ncbi:protein FAR1-RELATED SEQUENCE 5-like [Pyrus ussuriensis x Pyrus communis]|uniref:Protein FAR1-RELATED SEQUENCE 5-like n=1 Tax=Pyrus ussuriensis x Pyrus communis TaxID=2448454 RepID=A0A5N5FA78_9ROSA|nr:protein FAR1-RELATED SEQUENCE 5-like [Pyrus ussuriensis x Pyrus communis]
MAQLLDKEMKSNGDEIANKESNDVLNDATVRDTDGVNNSSDEAPVLNPPSVRPKGISNARLKSHMEKRKKKTSNVLGLSSKKLCGPSHTANANARFPSTNQFYPTMTMPIANSHACLPSPNQSLLTTNAHARFPSSNQFYPTTRLSTTNVQTSLPLSNQSPNYSWSCSPPNFAFTNVLQSQNCMTHLNQDAFPCGFEEHQDACNS